MGQIYHPWYHFRSLRSKKRSLQKCGSFPQAESITWIRWFRVFAKKTQLGEDVFFCFTFCDEQLHIIFHVNLDYFTDHCRTTWNSKYLGRFVLICAEKNMFVYYTHEPWLFAVYREWTTIQFYGDDIIIISYYKPLCQPVQWHVIRVVLLLTPPMKPKHPPGCRRPRGMGIFTLAPFPPCSCGLASLIV